MLCGGAGRVKRWVSPAKLSGLVRGLPLAPGRQFGRDGVHSPVFFVALAMDFWAVLWEHAYLRAR